MDSQHIFLSQPDFAARRAPGDELLIHLTEFSFSYAVIDAEEEQLKALFDLPDCENGPFALQQALHHDPVFELPFAHTYIAAQPDNQIFVPSAFASEDVSLSHYFRLTDANELRIYHDAAFDIRFTVPLTTEKLLPQFPSVTLMPLAAPLLHLSTHLPGDSLLLDVRDRSLSCLLRKNGQPVYAQTWEVENADELQYYLLLLSGQFELTTDTPVYVSGIVRQDDTKHERIRRCFTQVYFYLPDQQGMSLDLLETVPTHYYSSLLALRTCALSAVR